MREGAGYPDILFWHNISRFLWLCLSDFSGAILTDATGSIRAPYSGKDEKLSFPLKIHTAFMSKLAIDPENAMKWRITDPTASLSKKRDMFQVSS